MINSKLSLVGGALILEIQENKKKIKNKKISKIPLPKPSMNRYNHLPWIRILNPILYYLGYFTSYLLSSPIKSGPQA